MKRDFHKKDKKQPYEKKKDKASIRKEIISRKLRLKNNIQNFSDNSDDERYTRRSDIDDLYN